MSKKGRPKKLKNNLKTVVQGFFKKNPNSSFTHKQVCSMLDLREKALRKLTFTVLEDLTESSFLSRVSYGVMH